MDLVIGGICQGKRAYVQRAYNIQENEMISGEEISLTELPEAVCIYDFHRLVRRLLSEGRNPAEWTKQLLQMQTLKVVIANEVGSGVVPVDPFEREWREAAGRMSCILAEHAEHVFKVTCGIEQRIK